MATIYQANDLTADQRERLLSFLGYGNPKAPFVFVGMEEGLTETLDYPLLAQLRDRAALPAIVDLFDCSIHPGKYLSGARPPIQRTWGTLIAMMLCIRDKATDNETIRRYQRDQLGRTDGESLLLELMPLPARSMKMWTPYDVLFSDYDCRDSYLHSLEEKRVATIRETLAYGPKLVVLYGIGYWPKYRRIFPEITNWHNEGIFEYARRDATGVILMPHPVARVMNGERDRLCRIAREVTA
jgi:hypothetical protein